jgi:hypothetical protein
LYHPDGVNALRHEQRFALRLLWCRVVSVDEAAGARLGGAKGRGGPEAPARPSAANIGGADGLSGMAFPLGFHLVPRGPSGTYWLDDASDSPRLEPLDPALAMLRPGAVAAVIGIF